MEIITPDGLAVFTFRYLHPYWLRWTKDLMLRCRERKRHSRIVGLLLKKMASPQLLKDPCTIPLIQVLAILPVLVLYKS